MPGSKSGRSAVRASGLAAIVGILLVGIVVYLMTNSERRLMHIDERNSADLATIVDNLQKWPVAADAIAMQNAFATEAAGTAYAKPDAKPTAVTVSLQHPSIGGYRIVYERASVACRKSASFEFEPTAPKFGFSGEVSKYQAESGAPFDDDKQLIPKLQNHLKSPLCYKMSLPLAQMINLNETAPGLKTLLIAEGEMPAKPNAVAENDTSASSSTTDLPATDRSRILQQIGVETLPITSLADLRDEGSVYSKALLAFVKAAPEPIRIAGTRAPIDTRLGDKVYRVYVRQLTLRGVSDSARSTESDKPAKHTLRSKSAMQSSFAEIGGNTTTHQTVVQTSTDDATGTKPAEITGARSYLVVGVVDRSTMLADGPKPPVNWIIVFTLAFALLLSLTPTLKLLLLGPVDAIQPIEVLAVAAGLVFATAIATTTVLLGAAVIEARQEADVRSATAANWMANDIAEEIESIINPTQCRKESIYLKCPRSDELTNKATVLEKQGTRRKKPDGYTISVLGMRNNARTGKVDGHLEMMEPINFDRPESAVVVDKDGYQYSRLVTRRDVGGGRANVVGREYFNRIIRREFIKSRNTGAFETPGTGHAYLRFPKQYFTLGRVMARPDGLMKSFLTFPIERLSKPGEAGASALNFPWVSKPLLAPVLPAGVEFQIVDLSDPDLLVIAHSVSNRPQIERARFAQSRVGVAVLTGLKAQAPGPCPAPEKANTPMHPVHFSARYDGSMRLFAALRIACTDWAVLTNVDRDALDEASAESVLWGLVDWTTLLPILPVLALFIRGVAASRHVVSASRPVGGKDEPGSRDHTTFPAATRLFDAVATFSRQVRFSALWPNPKFCEVYRSRHNSLLILIVIALLLMAGNWFYDFPMAGMIAVGLPLMTAALLFRLGSEQNPDDDLPPTRLTARVEHAYAHCVAAVLICFAVLPVVAMTIDARRSYHEHTSAERARAEAQDIETRAKQTLAVMRSYYPDIRQGSQLDDSPQSKMDTTDAIGDYRLASDQGGSTSPTFTGYLQGLLAPPDVGEVSSLPVRDNPPPPEPEDSRREEWSALFVLAIALSYLLYRAAKRAMVALFGFGVPLKAVDYPEIPPRLWHAFDHKTMIVAAPDSTRKALLAEPGLVTIDLFNTGLPVAPADKTLVINLELILKNDALRLQALNVLERLVALQDKHPHHSCIVVLTTLSPLERLLHGYDLDRADVVDEAERERHRQRRQNFSENREAVRWSRLFEAFDTYYSQERPTVRTVLDQGDRSDEQFKIMATVYRELDYLPLSVLETGLPQTRDAAEAVTNSWAQRFVGLLRRERACTAKQATSAGESDRASALKLKWAEQLSGGEVGKRDGHRLAGPAAGPRAVIDYFAALFIEHYQLAWSASNHRERLLLNHLAHGRFLNIERAYQLGPLVRRGLVVLDPQPRLLNRSFAQFIRHAESDKTLEAWRRTTPKGQWSSAQLPVMLAIALGVGILLVFATQSGESIASYIPVMIGAGPALLHSLGLLKKTSA